MPEALIAPRRGARKGALPGSHAIGVAALFKVLGSPTRVRLLHLLLSRGEVRAGELAEAVGMTPQAVSNQLRRLADWDVVSARRVGSEMHYRVINPCIEPLLEKGRCVVRKQC